jgi:type IV pilus assembly protein PilB
MSGHQRIGQILLEKGLVTQDQLERALAERGDSYFRLGEILVSKGWLTEEGLLDCLAEQYHLPVVDLERTCPDIDTVEILGLGYCLARVILPICKRGDRLVCAVADPLETAFFQAMEDAKGIKIDVVLSTPDAIIAAIERLMGKSKRAV